MPFRLLPSCVNRYDVRTLCGWVFQHSADSDKWYHGWSVPHVRALRPRQFLCRAFLLRLHSVPSWYLCSDGRLHRVFTVPRRLFLRAGMVEMPALLNRGAVFGRTVEVPKWLVAA